MAFIDGSALNVALPAIQADLGASATDLLWINNAYALMLAALILVGGALGDRLGRKAVFMAGIGLFAAASAACGLAPSSAFLIAARTAQGVGGALMVPGSLALIGASFDDSSRGRAIGTWSALGTITTILGPALGGLLAGAGLWRMVFFINLPLALLALWALARYVPESRDESAPARLDYPGAALAALGLAGVTYGLISVSDAGWGSPLVLGALGLGLLALALFVAVEARSPNAMMPLAIFRSSTFSGTNLVTLFLYAALYGVLFFLPLNLVQAQGYPESLAGLASLPMALLLAGLSRWSGALADRIGPRVPLIVGPALAGCGFFALGLPGLTGGPADYWVSFFPGVALLGLGMAITVAPLTTAVMGSVAPHYAGVASGVNNAISRAAGVLAVAALGLVALTSFSAGLGRQTAGLGLSEPARAAVLAEAAQLGGAVPPAGLPAAQRDAVALAIRQAFSDMFRTLAIVGAGLAWISALIAPLLIAPGRLERQPAEQVGSGSGAG
jgi:EmrB/QacA subfamily drug resistance transporter